MVRLYIGGIYIRKKELAFKTFRPKLEYASTIWSTHTDKNIEAIQMIQRRAANWVSNKYSSYDSVTAMVSNLGWRSLEYRRCNTRLAMFHMALLQCICRHTLSVSSESLVTANTILSVSARFLLVLIITGVRSFP